jgi:hypothetical protein
MRLSPSNPVAAIEKSALEAHLLALSTLIEAAAAGEVAETREMEDIFSLLNDNPRSAVLLAKEVAKRAILFTEGSAR